MSPERDEHGVWFVVLPNGERMEFQSNAEAWRWLDRHERRETWVSSKAQWRNPTKHDVPQ